VNNRTNVSALHETKERGENGGGGWGNPKSRRGGEGKHPMGGVLIVHSMHLKEVKGGFRRRTGRQYQRRTLERGGGGRKSCGGDQARNEREL